MPGTLYVVATPIGNLEDVTLRALRILREVSVIAAEDTRRTARILQHYSISTRTTSLHEHNERSKAPALIARLTAGESVALVSDAGTPVVSDPGSALVAAAHAAGVRVEPVPGPSAVITALSVCGFPEQEFTFLGFPPSRSKARKAWLLRIAREPRTLVFYEAPHRIRSCLQDMLDAFGDRDLLIARELTKTHETLVVRPISAHLAHPLEERGEFTLVLKGAGELSRPAFEKSERPDPKRLAVEFGELTNSDGLGRREALKCLSERHSIPSREVYALLERAKKYPE
jgi:16S rRNA (cytidine1402-2'-O)-methyltransferase